MLKHRLYEWLEIRPRAAFIAMALWACGCAVALAGLSGGSVAGLVVLSLAIAGLCAWAHRKWLAIMFPCALLAGMAYTWYRVGNEEAQSARLFDKWTTVVAIAEECQPSADGRHARLWLRIEKFDDERLPANVLVMANVSAAAIPAELMHWHVGEPRLRIALQLKVSRACSAQFPWDFDEARYLQRRGAIGVGLVSKRQSVRVIGNEPVTESEKMSALADVIRQRMVALHRIVLGEQSGDLLSSMVIGDKAVRPSETIRQQFQALGLTHIIAASGFNLTIVTAVAWWSLRLFSRSAVANTVWCLMSIGFFCMLAGFSASVERAALMCSFLLLASLCRRSAHLPAVIGLALFVTTLLDPRALLDVGLQLSYAATLCIALCATRITRWLSERAHVPRPIAEIVAAVALANASVLPLQMVYFWQVGELSLPANIAVSPLVPPITVLGFISSALAAFGLPLLSVVAIAADWLVKLPLLLMMRIVEAFASNRWSVLSIGPPLAACVWFYYLALCALVAVICNCNSEAVYKRFLMAAVCIYLVGAFALFVRLPLKSPIIIESRDAALLVVPSGNAYWVGRADNMSIERAVKYLALNRYIFVPMRFDGSLTTLGAQQPKTVRSSQSSVFESTPTGMRRVQKIEELWM